MVDSQPVRRARHLMDPANPTRQVNDAQLTTVQRWVMSVLAVVTIGHLSAGLVVAGYFIDEQQASARIGLCLIAGGFGIVAVAVGRGIHRKPLVSPWLLLGTLPSVVGVALILLT